MITAIRKFMSFVQLALWMAALGSFVFFIPRILMLSPFYSDFRDRIESLAIETSALFYTEEPHTMSSARIIENRIDSRHGNSGRVSEESSRAKIGNKKALPGPEGLYKDY